MGADGELDVTASFRKVDEHRASLEKRLGTGDIRPKTPDEYKLPDTDVFKNLQLDDAGAKAFRKEAHDMGLSQAQYEGIMGKWASLAPELVNAGKTETVEATVSELQTLWKDDFKTEMQGAFRSISAVADAAGIPFEEAEKAIGNNPVAIRMFAHMAKEMREDATPPAANGAATAGVQSYEEFVAQNYAAYSNPKDPQHKAITEQANRLLARTKTRT